MTLAVSVLIQYRLRRTDRHVAVAKTRSTLSVARVKMCKQTLLTRVISRSYCKCGWQYCLLRVVVVHLPDDVGATAYFPASYTGSPTLPAAIDSPTWAQVGAPTTPQYVTADLFAAAGANGPSVIVAAESPSSQHHQQHQSQQQPVPAQPVHVLQPYPQHVSVVPAPQPAVQQQPQHPAGYLQQPTPAPAPLPVCNRSVFLRSDHK